MVELPAPLLREGIVFVDTPGLGALATSGAAETRAYLPQCDLGVVLIDAGSTLAEEDLATIQALYEAGVPASVLLSKADLLTPKDLESALAYTAEQIRGHLGLALKVQPVSIVGDCAALSDKWFEEQIKPLYKRHQQLADESVRRKIAALRESVEAALRSKLDRIEGTRPPDVEALRLMERELRRAAGRIPEETSGCLQSIEEVDELAPLALRDAARRIIERWRQGQNAEAGIVTASALETACAVTNPLYSRLVAFARELTDSLQQAAKLLNATDFPQEEDLVSALREMPQFDFHWKALSFKRSPFVSLAAPLVKVGLERRLHYLIGPGMQEAFRSYQRLLEAWVRRAIAEIHTRFDSHADAYRAHLARLLGSAEASPHVAERIRRDLAALRGDGASQTNA